VPAHPVTPEDLLKMPDGNRFELVKGRLVEPDMSFWASYIAGEILFLLRDFLRTNRIGWVLHRGNIRLLREKDELSGEDVLPGFRCPVAPLFVLPTTAVKAGKEFQLLGKNAIGERCWASPAPSGGA
jgi:Putative restriction endonuclease